MFNLIIKLLTRGDNKTKGSHNIENIQYFDSSKIEVSNFNIIAGVEDKSNDASAEAEVISYSENNVDLDLIFAEVMSIKERINIKINQQVGKLQLNILEKRAWKRILKQGINNENANSRIKSKLNGITQLLEDGELSIALFSDISKEKYISSACLQPFCNATEIMIYVCFVLLANTRELNEFVQTEMGEYTKKIKLYEIIKSIPKETLGSVLDDYRQYRNTIAHTYQIIPIEAAYAFIQRTYENIQRLELLITRD